MTESEAHEHSRGVALAVAAGFLTFAFAAHYDAKIGWSITLACVVCRLAYARVDPLERARRSFDAQRWQYMREANQSVREERGRHRDTEGCA